MACPDNNRHTQNAFDVLVATSVWRANGPAYVTGTGAHDTIRIDGARKGLANGQAQVTVRLSRCGSHGLIESQSYKIDTANGNHRGKPADVMIGSKC